MFAFSQIDPETRGQVAVPKVPLSRYLGANWDQGFEDSAFRSVEKITEMGLADPDSPGLLESATMSLNEIADRSAPKISAEEANNKYSLPGLTFERPVIEAQARLINERRRAELERSYYLDDADTNPLRWTTGVGARIAGGMMNPLDLGINFMPIVGSEKAAASVLGRGTREGASALEQLLAKPRAALARGLIPEESLMHLPAPHFTASLINGAVGQAAFEVPVAIAKMQELQDYNASDFAEAVLGGAAFAGALHVALAGAGRLFRRLRPETREVMLRKAVDDFVKGDNISVHDLVTIDDNAIRDKVKWDPQRVRAEAEAFVNEQMPELEKDILKKRNEIVAAAVKLPDGRVETGDMHPLIWAEISSGPDEAESLINEGAQNGFVLKDGTFITSAEAEKIMGVGDSEQVQETLRSPVEGGYITSHGNFVSSEDAPKFEKSLPIDEQFLQRAIKSERQKAIKRFIEKKRREFDPDKAFSDEARAEIQRQVAEGKVVGPEASKKYGATDLVSASDVAKVEEDVKELERQLGVENQDQEDVIDHFIDKLKIDTGGPGVKEGITGLPVLVWNGSLEVVRMALKGGRTIAQAISEAIAWIKENHPRVELDKKDFRTKLRGAFRPDPFASAALKDLNTGEIFSGKPSHIELIDKIPPSNGSRDLEQGWMTKSGKYLSPEEIAIREGVHNIDPIDHIIDNLRSKDLPDLDKAIDAGVDCIVQGGGGGSSSKHDSLFARIEPPSEVFPVHPRWADLKVGDRFLQRVAPIPEGAGELWVAPVPKSSAGSTLREIEISKISDNGATMVADYKDPKTGKHLGGFGMFHDDPDITPIK